MKAFFKFLLTLFVILLSLWVFFAAFAFYMGNKVVDAVQNGDITIEQTN